MRAGLETHGERGGARTEDAGAAGAGHPTKREAHTSRPADVSAGGAVGG